MKPTKRQIMIVEDFVKKTTKSMMKNKKKLSESDEWKLGGSMRMLQDKFSKMATNDIVPIINAQTKWDYENIAELVKELLIDANFHDEAPKVYEFMMNLD